MGWIDRGAPEHLRLHSESLLSKWGFNDGDVPDDAWDYCEANGLNPENWHATLIRLVRDYLLPVLEQDVEVVEIGTIHNPIRAKDIDAEITPVFVDVPFATLRDYLPPIIDPDAR